MMDRGMGGTKNTDMSGLGFCDIQHVPTCIAPMSERFSEIVFSEFALTKTNEESKPGVDIGWELGTSKR